MSKYVILKYLLILLHSFSHIFYLKDKFIYNFVTINLNILKKSKFTYIIVNKKYQNL